MRHWSWTFLIVASAVGLALLAQNNDANVALFVPPHRIDLSMNLAVALLAGLFLLLYGVLRLGAWTLGFPRRVRAYRERRQQTRETDGLLRAWTAWLEGRYARALREAEAVINTQPRAPVHVMAGVVAARASASLQEPERATGILEGLKTLSDRDPSWRALVLIAQIEGSLEQGHFAQALQALDQLHAGGRRTVFSLRLALKAHQGLKNWSDTLKIVRMLSKRRALHPLVGERLVAQAALALVVEAAREGLENLEHVWRFLSATERHLPAVAVTAAAQFQRLGANVMARQILELALSQQWSSEVLAAYGHSAGPTDSALRLEQAEFWRRSHPDDPLLLRVLGELCLHAQLWGQAQQYLERSLVLHPHPRTHALLAQCLELIGKNSLAANHWRQAARLGHADVAALDSTHPS